MDDSSPYEPVAPNRHPDTFRLASISSGIAGLIFAVHLVFSHKRRDIFLERVNERLITTIRGCKEPCINISSPAFQWSAVIMVDYLT